MTAEFVNQASCPFCKTSSRWWTNGEQRTLYGFDCEICGQFFISQRLHDKLKDHALDSALLNCISENIKTNAPRGKYPIITSWHSRFENELPSLASDITVKRFEYFAELPINHASKVSDLLLLIASKVTVHRPFEQVALANRDLYLLKILDVSELCAWAEVLEKEGYCKKITNIMPERPGVHNVSFAMLPAGWEQAFTKQQSANSKKVFVAMQFNWGDENEKKNQYVEAIKSGCRDCGYEAELVSDQHHIQQITDQIVAKIKSARFVVADFTFNNRGAYYEAGLARGLAIPVIHTVMTGHTSDQDNKDKQLHFDIKQINYLEWSDPVQLRQQISDRIKAVIER